MRHKNLNIDYTGIETVNNILAGDSIGIALRPSDIVTLSPSKILSREGVMMDVKSKKISDTYNQIIMCLLIFLAFATYTLITGKVLNKTESVLLLILALSGLIAFHNDKERWRKQSAK